MESNSGNVGRLRRALPPILAVAGLLVVWQAACAAFRIDPWMLPDPWSIVRRMAEDGAMLSRHVLATLRLALGGVGLGIVCGVLIALTLHALPWLRSAASPIVVLTQNIPLIALGPLLMLWFGFGLTPKFILIVLVCFFPIAWSMLSGMSQADPQLREYLAMIGASRWEVLTRLELPASLPSFFAGLKIAVTYSMTSTVVAEWLGASEGVGYYLVLKSRGYDTTAVFGAIVCIVALSLLLYAAAAALEKAVVRWAPERVKSQGGAVIAWTDS